MKIELLKIFTEIDELCAKIDTPLNYDNEPVTELSYVITVDDVNFVVSYKRKGLPGNKCYIKEVTRKELVCDL